jgi:hypothetical protein
VSSNLAPGAKTLAGGTSSLQGAGTLQEESQPAGTFQEEFQPGGIVDPRRTTAGSDDILNAIPSRTLPAEEKRQLIAQINAIMAAAGFEAINIADTNSRDELLTKVSTEKELLGVLDKFRDFKESFPCDTTSMTDSSNGVITTEPEGSVKICYKWEPSQVVKEKYSILMLKFIGSSNELMKNKIDYAISITNGPDAIYSKIGSTSTGIDLKIVDENTFSTDSSLSPVNYDMNIAIPAVDDTPTNEYAGPLVVSVISEIS